MSGLELSSSGQVERKDLDSVTFFAIVYTQVIFYVSFSFTQGEFAITSELAGYINLRGKV